MQPFERLSQRELAEALGISLTTLQNWMRQGCPSTIKGDKKVFSLPGVLAWRDQQGRGKAGKLDKERARLAKEQADNLSLKNAQLRGELIPKDAVEQELGKVFVAFRSRILSIDTKAAPRLVGCSSIPEIKSILRGMNEEALSELSGFDFSRCDGSGAGDDTESDTAGGATAAADRKRVGRPGKKAVKRVERRARPVDHVAR